MKTEQLLSIYSNTSPFLAKLALVKIKDSRRNRVPTGVVQGTDQIFPASLEMSVFHLWSWLNLSPNRHSKYGDSLREHPFIMIGESSRINCQWWNITSFLILNSMY